MENHSVCYRLKNGRGISCCCDVVGIGIPFCLPETEWGMILNSTRFGVQNTPQTRKILIKQKNES